MAKEQLSFTGRCPMCQYSDKTVIKPVSNVMNTYRNEKGQIAVIPSSEKEIDNPSGKWILQAPSKDQQILSPRIIPGVVSQQTLTAAVSAASVTPIPFSDAGDPVTGLAKGATIKQPNNVR
jgi:hypothetical protein